MKDILAATNGIKLKKFSQDFQKTWPQTSDLEVRPLKLELHSRFLVVAPGVSIWMVSFSSYCINKTSTVPACQPGKVGTDWWIQIYVVEPLGKIAKKTQRNYLYK